MCGGARVGGARPPPPPPPGAAGPRRWGAAAGRAGPGGPLRPCWEGSGAGGGGKMPVPRHPAGSGGWAAGRPGAGAGGARASRSFRERAPPSSRRCARPRCSPLGRRGGGGRSVPLPCPGARSRCRRAQEAVAVLRGPLVLTRVFPFRFWSPGCKVNGLPQRVVELPRVRPVGPGGSGGMPSAARWL